MLSAAGEHFYPKTTNQLIHSAGGHLKLKGFAKKEDLGEKEQERARKEKRNKKDGHAQL
jgi:hypothetical protein